MLISFLNDADIKTISEFKDSFGKYYPVKFFGEKCNKRCITLSFFDLETQNLNLKSITKTVLEKSKKKKFRKRIFRARCFFGQAVLQKLTGL
jgi:hypothetical protein